MDTRRSRGEGTYRQTFTARARGIGPDGEPTSRAVRVFGKVGERRPRKGATVRALTGQLRDGESLDSATVRESWQGRATAADGRRLAVYAFTREDAARKLDKALRAAEDGAAPIDERITVAAFLVRWLEAVRPQVRPGTFHAYESHVRVHLAPSLGRLQLAKLTAAHVDGMLADKLGSGMHPATVNRMRATFRRALGQALDWGLVRENVVKRTKAAKETPYQVEPLTADQARALLAASASDALHALWALALGTGLRQGEALALAWSDMDLDAGTVHVRHTLQRAAGGGWTLAPPKSKRARRTVNLPGFVVTAVRSHRASQGREKLASGPAWQETGFVFTTSRGTPLDGPNVTHRLQRALAAAGLPRQRFHDLRHAAASLLLAQGADMRTVMEVLGHSSIGLTANTYAHVGKAAMKDAADKMDAALG